MFYNFTQLQGARTRYSNVGNVRGGGEERNRVRICYPIELWLKRLGALYKLLTILGNFAILENSNY